MPPLASPAAPFDLGPSKSLALAALDQVQLEAFTSFFAKPENYPYYLCETLLPRNKAQALQYLQAWDDGDRFLALAVRDHEQVVGLLSFDDIDHRSGQAEFGLALFPEAQGKGLAIQAGHLALAYAFGELNLHKLRARHMGANQASKRMLEGLGFVPEGCWKEAVRRGHCYEDLFWYGLLRAKYLEAQR